MKLVIVGPEKRSKSSIMLLKKAKKYFSKVLYAPYPRIILSAKHGATYKKTKISDFNAVLPRIPRRRNIFGYLLTKTLEAYSPIKSYSFIISSDRFLLFDILKSEGIDVPEIYYTDSVKSASRMLEKKEVKFPLAMRLAKSNETMIPSNSKEAKSMLSALKTFKNPVYIEEYSKGRYLDVYVVDDDVELAIRKKPKDADDIYKGRGKSKITKPKKGVKETALRVTTTLKTDFARIRMLEKSKQIVDISLSPALTSHIKASDKDLADELMKMIVRKTDPKFGLENLGKIKDKFFR